MYGQTEKGLVRWKTTVYGPLVVVLLRYVSSVQMPWSPLMACTRSNEYLTSADVIESPFENFTLWRRWHVQVLRFFVWPQPVASTGLSWAPVGNPYSPW